VQRIRKWTWASVITLWNSFAIKRKHLERLIEMKDEVLLFLEQHPPSAWNVILEFKDRFHEFDWLTKVAYLCDIFCFLNELRLNLQGVNINIFKVQEKGEATIRTLRLWTQRVEKGNFKYFCILTELQENMLNLLSQMRFLQQLRNISWG
jgi:hypothetical protein